MRIVRGLYECGICECWHPWEWDGDCRDDANRYHSPEEYAKRHNLPLEKVALYSMEQRLEADIA